MASVVFLRFLFSQIVIILLRLSRFLPDNHGHGNISVAARAQVYHRARKTRHGRVMITFLPPLSYGEELPPFGRCSMCMAKAADMPDDPENGFNPERVGPINVVVGAWCRAIIVGRMSSAIVP